MTHRSDSRAAEVEIDETGDAWWCDFIRGLRPIEPKQKLNVIPTGAGAPVGEFDTPNCECINDPQRHVEITSTTDLTPPQTLIRFEPSLSQELPLDLDIRGNAYHAFCLYDDDLKGVPEGNCFGVGVKGLFESLCLTVRIKAKIAIKSPRVPGVTPP